MISDMRVSELGDRVLLDLPRSTADAVRQQLDRLHLQRRRRGRRRARHATHLGLYGPAAAAILGRVVACPVSDAGGRDANRRRGRRTERLAGLTPGANDRWLFRWR